jgi:hypothetical protein
MNLMMTSWVQQGQIICRVCAAINQPNPVMAMPSRDSGDRLLTDQAPSLLFLPE